MGATVSSNMELEELVHFKGLPHGAPLDDINIPEREEYRIRTDKNFIIAFSIFIIILMPFLIYTLAHSDIHRLIHGYDSCGNVCGKNNTKNDLVDCTGKDYTNKKYLKIEPYNQQTNSERRCVTECGPSHKPSGRICVKVNTPSINIYSMDENNEEKGIEEYLKSIAARLMLCIVLGLAITLGMVFLLRTQTATVVWGIMGGTFLFGLITLIIMWYLYFTNDAEHNKDAYLVFGIVFSVLSLGLICFIIFMYNKIFLVIALLKEATKAALAMPVLVFTPILAVLLILVICVSCVITTLYMATSGVLMQEENTQQHQYKVTLVMLFTIIFNICIALWSVHFVIGIQYMVIAGAVSKWYFAENKNNLNRPITTSTKIVLKFHLGSVAFGSMVITLVAILRVIIQSLIKNRALKPLVNCIMGPIERFLKFLTKNAYIVTAMHGKPFYQSGKRAAQIIFQNVVNIASINYIGDFVLCMAKVFIILVTMLITYGVIQGTSQDYEVYAYLIVFISTLIISCTFFAIFETTIDTIFLCFCEDQELNDGMARPYAMSRNLMEFVEKSKKIYGAKKN